MNQEQTNRHTDQPTDKLPYHKPTLTEFGKVQDLTRGPSGGGDGGPGGRG